MSGQSFNREKWSNGTRTFTMKDGRKLDEGALSVGTVVPHEGFTQTAIHVRHAMKPSLTTDAPPNLIKPPAWTAGERPCIPPKGLDPEVARKWMDQWDVTGGPKARRISTAEALCTGCPVLETCREAALEEEWGAAAQYRFMVRGGLLPEQRHTVERDRVKATHGNRGP